MILVIPLGRGQWKLIRNKASGSIYVALLPTLFLGRCKHYFGGFYTYMGAVVCSRRVRSFVALIS